MIPETEHCWTTFSLTPGKNLFLLTLAWVESLSFIIKRTLHNTVCMLFWHIFAKMAMQIHTLLSLLKKGRRHEVSAWEVYTLLSDREKTYKCQNFISSSTNWAPWEWGLCFLILHLQPTGTSDPATGMCLVSNCWMAKVLWLWGLLRTSPMHSIIFSSVPFHTIPLTFGKHCAIH